MKHSKEKHSRSIAKAISWRVIATATTMVVVYIFTGNFLLTLGIGSLEATAKMLFYYMHERAWNEVSWGKHKK